jgi:hypothetical protein
MPFALRLYKSLFAFLLTKGRKTYYFYFGPRFGVLLAACCR